MLLLAASENSTGQTESYAAMHGRCGVSLLQPKRQVEVAWKGLPERVTAS